MTKPEPPEPFGSQLYDELRKIGGFSVIASMLDFDAIQRLKRAGRDEAACVFWTDCPEVEGVILNGTPREAARAIGDEAKRRAARVDGMTALDIVFALLKLWAN